LEHVTVVRSGLSLVMVGRAGELRRLQVMAEGMTEPRVVLLHGEAGVGKSRLVREFVATLPDHQVFAAHAEPGPLGRPFHLLHEAIERRVGSWTSIPPELASSQEPLQVLLGPVAPILNSDPSSDVTVGGEQSLRAAVDLVRYLLDGRPGVLVVEDLHWADAESLRLIGRLATTADLPLLIVGTFRPGVAEGRLLADMIDRVARQRLVEHVELAPLTETQVAEWLAAVYQSRVPWRVATDLARRTSGNPFFLEELVSSAPGVELEALCALPLPISVSEAVLRHLDGLPDTQRQIVDSAAVLGRRIPFDLLAVVSGAGEDDLIATMRELVERGLVTEIEPDVFSFRHALTREAVASRLLGRQRRRLHEKAHAALLEMGSDDWGALAYHAAGAHLWDEVVDAARRGAAVHLRTGSTYEALRLAELGLQEVDADAVLLELATRAAWACGLMVQAANYASLWAGLAEAGANDGELSRALRALARLKWEIGDTEQHAALVSRLLSVADRLPDGHDLAAVYSYVAEVRMLAGQSAEAVAWADRALALMADDDDMRAAAMVNKGSAVFDIPGRFDEGAALLVSAIDTAVDEGDVFSALRGLNNLLQGVLVRWPAEQVWPHIVQMNELVSTFGRHDWVSSLAAITASYYSNALGNPITAREVLENALIDSMADGGGKRGWLFAERAWLAGELGDDDGMTSASAMFAMAPITVGCRSSAQNHWLETLSMEAAARVGDVATVASRLADLGRRAEAAPTGVCDLSAWTWGVGLLAAVRVGIEPADVAHVLELLFISPNRSVREEDVGWGFHVQAALAAASGDHLAAIDLYRAALAEPRRRPGAVIDADVRVGLARSLLVLGRVDEAQVAVDEAATFMTQWPGWRRDEVQSLQRRLAAGGARVASGHLTARELEVAALVAEGLSNSEIGRKLFISTKTASVHVSNILAKLSMSSRTQIAAWAVAEGVGR
jgi:DNA-binding CsgD family transcriptional regulator/tetratricopeptide (TPR) repeat protein